MEKLLGGWAQNYFSDTLWTTPAPWATVLQFDNATALVLGNSLVPEYHLSMSIPNLVFKTSYRRHQNFCGHSGITYQTEMKHHPLQDVYIPKYLKSLLRIMVARFLELNFLIFFLFLSIFPLLKGQFPQFFRKTETIYFIIFGPN